MELRCELQRKHIEFLNMMSIDGWRIHVRMDHSVLLNSIYILQPNTQISYFYFLVFFFLLFLLCMESFVCSHISILVQPLTGKKIGYKKPKFCHSIIRSFYLDWKSFTLLYHYNYSLHTFTFTRPSNYYSHISASI